MYQTVPVEEKDSADNVWPTAIVFMLLLGLAILVSQYKPEWINFIWLSIATISAAAFAGWIIGFVLDMLFEEVD